MISLLCSHGCFILPTRILNIAPTSKIAREADAVIALTAYERNVLVNQVGVAPERVHVTGVGPVLSADHCVDTFRRTYGIHDRYVLFIGRQVPHKGYEAILSAVPFVWQKFSDVHFVFIGPTTRRSMRVFQAQADYRIHNLGPSTSR